MGVDGAGGIERETVLVGLGWRPEKTGMVCVPLPTSAQLLCTERKGTRRGVCKCPIRDLMVMCTGTFRV